ncbi:HdeD family acid-resistance protein [Chitinophaga japonensis]|uniref:Uncharacterized membrane protein HdeD (DUF308 family) n=1 Tax=Chitinophaga japonensis TaxID=104662 RepID=A0A562T0I3_CHIJA|nr:HdeD family acid-resistance protein [Chitinophaga japonensis]TWI87031.1 uncharacterized membrane protein HdeD (DUF308 family) [Chitinophaga japonensis]
MQTPISRYWWVFLLRGIAALLIGLLAIFVPGITFGTLVLFLGAYMFIDGIFSIIAGISARKQSRDWGWYIVSGLFGIIIGVITFANPFATGIALIYIAGVWAIVAGIVEIIVAVRLRKEITGEGWYIAGGILTILFGILIFINPVAGALTLTIIFGIYAIVAGVMLVSLSMRLRKKYKSHRSIPVT